MESRENIVALGEVLWDVFPDAAYFGGAPANFACTAAELGGNACRVTMVSAVGRDDLGRRATDLLNARGVNTDCVARVEQPTGQVLVTLDRDGCPSYTIETNAAWDNVAWHNGLQELAAGCDAVSFGTLAQRSEVARHTIQTFLRATPRNCLRILDINLREPFWNKEILLQSLELANVVKLNDAELPILAQVIEWEADQDALIDRLLQTCSLHLVALTRGANGAVLASSTGERVDLQGRTVPVVDTVGAGDAYTAALVIGMLRELPLETINAWACRVAEFVCSQSGATPQLPDQLRQP